MDRVIVLLAVTTMILGIAPRRAGAEFPTRPVELVVLWQAGHVRTGAMGALATFGDARDALLPEVPTAKEQGFPVLAAPWTGIVTPKATPPEVLAKLQDVFEAVMKDPDFIAGMDKLGERITPLVGDAFAARWKQDHEQWEGPSRAVRK